MKTLTILVDKLSDWSAYYPEKRVTAITDYLESSNQNPGYVINLCRDYSYQSSGYYGSLLAEARGDTPFPSVKAITVLNNAEKDLLLPRKLCGSLEKQYLKHHQSQLSLELFFGETSDPGHSRLGKHIFRQFRFPALTINLSRHGEKVWSLQQIEALSLNTLNDDQQSRFADALDRFSHRIWRKPGKEKPSLYDLAILINPDEEMPPSDKKALKLFEKAARELQMDVDFITTSDIDRIPQYDALFIRETTSVIHNTYRCARRAEQHGLVVIDSPSAILTCANKVYLHELMQRNNIDMPESVLVMAHQTPDPEQIIRTTGLPAVVKIPDGAFSIGVEKASTAEELASILERLFQRSAILLVQRFLPTEFDWRIGVLNGKAIYACRYFMARDHWQIYNHKASRQFDQSGAADAMAPDDVPAKVLKTAVKAARLMGDGLFGVDLKEKDGRVMVIEVNDNPSIDKGVEDLHAGYSLYQVIMKDFLRRLEQSHGRQPQA